MPLPPPAARFAAAQAERRKRERLNRIRFVQNNRKVGDTVYGPATLYPGSIQPKHFTNGFILGLDNILDGAALGIQNPTIP